MGIILNLDKWFRTEVSFKDISYLELCLVFCSAQSNICAILVEGIMKNILNLDQWFRRRCCLKTFLI